MGFRDCGLPGLLLEMGNVDTGLDPIWKISLSITNHLCRLKWKLSGFQLQSIFSQGCNYCVRFYNKINVYLFVATIFEVLYISCVTVGIEKRMYHYSIRYFYFFCMITLMLVSSVQKNIIVFCVMFLCHFQQPFVQLLNS